ELQAKFSMEFCMAILLLEGRAGLSEFTDEVVMRPDVQAMIKKVDFGVDPEAEAAGFHKMTTIITITLTDGKVIRGSADFGRGSPAMPMTYDEVADKFRENCEFAKFSSQKANQVVEMIRGIEKVGSIRELTTLLAI
ncbi:MAG: MmgE/PrpD family protein, partial [Burkholderiaceae bacterium]